MRNDEEQRDARIVRDIEAKLAESRRASAIVYGYEELITGMYRFVSSLSEERDLKLLREAIDDRLTLLQARKEANAAE